MALLYTLFRNFIRVALRFYFRKINVEGLENIPKNTPLLITANHQNALIDPLLIGAFTPHPVHFLTRSDVFKWWISPMMKWVNMMPIYRIRDGYSKLSLNDAVFETCKEVFKQNGSVLIFAEGNHGKEYYLRPLTKGAARLALQSQEVLNDQFCILPVGLNYFQHREPRSTVIIKYGHPISVADHMNLYQEDRTAGFIEMRDTIAEGMREALVIPEETEDYQKRKALIFQSKNQDLSFQALQQINIATETLEDQKPSSHFIAKMLNPLPYLIIHRVLSRVEDVVFHSTLKFGIGLFVFPIWWIIVFSILWSTIGINVAFLGVIVMISGLFYSYQR